MRSLFKSNLCWRDVHIEACFYFTEIFVKCWGKNIPRDYISLYLQFSFQSEAERLSYCVLKPSKTQEMLVVRSKEICKKHHLVIQWWGYLMPWFQKLELNDKTMTLKSWPWTFHRNFQQVLFPMYLVFSASVERI